MILFIAGWRASSGIAQTTIRPSTPPAGPRLYGDICLHKEKLLDRTRLHKEKLLDGNRNKVSYST